MANLLKDVIIPIVAVIALIQPWFLRLWKRYLRKVNVEIYKTRTIEIGYTSLGPIITLQGTLRATGRDCFIVSIELLVVRLSDGSRHKFDGEWFGSQTFIAGAPETRLEVAHSFMLNTSQPHRYSVVFVDRKLGDEIRPIVEKVQMEWNKTYSSTALENIKQLEEAHSDTKTGSSYQTELEKLYRAFFDSTLHVDAYTSLDRLCYWQPGSYEIQMRVKTHQPSGQYTKKWRFELTEQSVKTLRLNVLEILRQTCGQYFQNSYVYIEYEEI